MEEIVNCYSRCVMSESGSVMRETTGRRGKGGRGK